jgi:hypothetical protein
MNASQFEFDYELDFVNIYDLSVITNSSVPNKTDPAFQQQVQSTVNNILMILRFQQGVKDMSTFVTYNNLKYKINMAKQ